MLNHKNGQDPELCLDSGQQAAAIFYLHLFIPLLRLLVCLQLSLLDLLLLLLLLLIHSRVLHGEKSSVWPGRSKLIPAVIDRVPLGKAL